MDKIKVLDLSANAVKEIAVDKAVVVKPHTQAMFDQVLAENGGERQGTHSTLTKAEVRGGGKKPVPQKKTGRARQGSTRNPHMAGGGVAFGPKPTRNYKTKVNAKVSKLAFKSALNVKLLNNSVFGLDDKISLSKPSTKRIVAFLEAAKLNGKKNLIVVNDEQENLINSAKGINRLVVKKYNQVSTRDLLNANNVILQETALIKVMEGCK